MREDEIVTARRERFFGLPFFAVFCLYPRKMENSSVAAQSVWENNRVNYVLRKGSCIRDERAGNRATELPPEARRHVITRIVDVVDERINFPTKPSAQEDTFGNFRKANARFYSRFIRTSYRNDATRYARSARKSTLFTPICALMRKKWWLHGSNETPLLNLWITNWTTRPLDALFSVIFTCSL